MKKVAFIALVTVLSLVHSTAALAQRIEINGLRLGMTKTEIEKKFGALPLKDFKIAKVSGKFPVRLAFHEGKLDELMFFFSSDSFNDVHKAVTSKYPLIACTDSTLTSPTEKKFTQVNCKMKDQLGTLRLDRFVRDIDTSALILISDRLFQELETKRKEKQTDKEKSKANN
jgi:hypothetical protein